MLVLVQMVFPNQWVICHEVQALSAAVFCNWRNALASIWVLQNHDVYVGSSVLCTLIPTHWISCDLFRIPIKGWWDGHCSYSLNAWICHIRKQWECSDGRSCTSALVFFNTPMSFLCCLFLKLLPKVSKLLGFKRMWKRICEERLVGRFMKTWKKLKVSQISKTVVCYVKKNIEIN